MLKLHKIIKDVTSHAQQVPATAWGILSVPPDTYDCHLPITGYSTGVL